MPKELIVDTRTPVKTIKTVENLLLYVFTSDVYVANFLPPLQNEQILECTRKIISEHIAGLIEHVEKEGLNYAGIQDTIS